MAVRHFTRASQEYLTFAPGSALDSVSGGLITLAWIWKPATVHAGGLIYAAKTAAAGTKKWAINEFSDGNTWYSTDTAAQPTGSYTAAGDWLLNACANDEPGVDRRSHRYNFTSQAWSHVDSGTSVASADAAIDHLRVGRFDNSGTEYLDGDLAVLAVWDRFVADAELEGLTASLAAWLASAPKGLWAFDQTDVATNVPDLTGNGANQTARVGTSVTVGADPPGFSFSLPGDEHPAPVDGARGWGFPSWSPARPGRSSPVRSRRGR